MEDPSRLQVSGLNLSPVSKAGGPQTKPSPSRSPQLQTLSQSSSLVNHDGRYAFPILTLILSLLS